MKTYVERILIVLNADGSLKGAAQYSLTPGGDGVPDVQGLAEPLDPEALASVLPDAAALTAQNAVLIEERDSLAKELAEFRKKAAVTRAQFIAGLKHGGLFDAVNGFFASLPDGATLPDGSSGTDAKTRWATALYFSPVEPLLLSIATGKPFNMTEEQISDLFTWARVNA